MDYLSLNLDIYSKFVSIIMQCCISNSSVIFSIHYNLQDMYMHTRPPFVLQGMVALPSFIILDFCVCNFNLVWSDSSSAELWLSVDTHHDTRIGAEVSAILTFMHACKAGPLKMYGECLLTQQNTLHHQIEGRFPICLGGMK